jgi:hypothetical protein
MMTDQELLTYAAKAAGIDDKIFIPVSQPYGYYWNPLTDDGEALRLAVKLAMGINCMELSQFQVTTYDDKGNPTYLDDTCVRRAIVRAAAEMGKGM